jgi:photosystem II stability/assembly factor-like uncharacterized protein
MKINYACGLLAVLLLSAWLMPFPAQAGPTALEWEALDKPGVTGNLVVTPSEVSEIAIGSDGVFYVADSENSNFYRSLDGGVTWEDITSHLVNDGVELGPASKIAVAPDKPGIVAVVNNDGTKVYLSTDGGIDWTDTGSILSLVGTIQAIAISSEYTQGSKSFWEIAIGTAKWGDDHTSGQVWVYQFGNYGTSWQNQYLTVDASRRGGEVSALAYSPNYQSDATLLVVASTNGDVSAVPINYRNKTWLCLLERDSGGWNHLPGYPVKIADAGDVGVSYIHSSLALPSDYSSDEASSRQLFVSYDRESDANDDVYWLNDTAVTRLNADGGSAINIASIAYYGTTISGTLLAGDVDRVPSSLTVQVRRNIFDLAPSPTWQTASVPPTGPGNAKVAWSPDGELAYCGTSKPPGVTLAEPDESAFSASLDGDKWRQMGLIDTVIRLGDIVLTPDSKSLLVTTYSPFGPEGIWRSGGDPLGRLWERLLTVDTLPTSAGVVILRMSLNYSDDYTMYAAEVGGSKMAVTHNRGNSWQWCRATPGPIIDMAIGDEETIYAALPEGYVRKSTNGARTWRDAVETGLASINMLAMVDKETILVGGKNGDVAYSADGGESFTRIREVIGSGSGDIQVIADTNYQENHTIYAATNLADEGIWRWMIGVSTRWEQIDESITKLGEGESIGGLAIGPEGTLYALRIEPASSTSGGVTRSLNPSELDTTKVEFDLVNDALPAGATFGPTPAFPNTLSCLKLSGDAKQNELWAIDGANQIIYRYQDTLCKLGPTPEMPKPGGIVPIDSSGYITNLTLGWEELGGATRYEAAIYLDSDATKGVWSGTSYGIEIVATDGSNPAQLLSGTTYYWRVRAIEPVKSPWSETRSFSPALGAAQWSPLATSTGVSPPPDASNVPIRPAFAWNPADGATSYEFVLARDSQFTDVVVALTGADALSITTWGCDRDLDYSTTYFWKVRAISSTSYSNWGTSVFTTEAAPTAPLPPQSSPQSPVPEPTPTIPSYLVWAAISLGVILFVVLLVFIVRR